MLGKPGGRSWPERMGSLLRSAALAVGSQVSEEVEPWRLTAPLVLVTGHPDTPRACLVHASP